MSNDRQPPKRTSQQTAKPPRFNGDLYSETAERSLLACILIDAINGGHTKALDLSAHLSSDEFYFPQNRAIFEAITRLNEQGVNIDLETVSDAAKHDDSFLRANGMLYLVDLQGMFGSGVNTEHWAKDIKRLALARKIKKLADAVSQDPHSCDMQTLLASAMNDEQIWRKSDYRQVSIDFEALSFERLSATMKSITWAWNKWLPNGLLTLLVSAQGVGKSSLLMRIAQCYTSGCCWPDDTPFNGETGKVLWCEGEGALTLNLERAGKWGIPLSMLITPFDHNEDVRDLDLNQDEDFRRLERFAGRADVKIILMDSLSGLFRGVDESKSEMIGKIKRIADIAAETGKPIVLVHHLRKGTVNDSTLNENDQARGSSGITAIARVIWRLDVPDSNDKENKRLRQTKNNLAPFASPLGMTIDKEGVKFNSDAPEDAERETAIKRAKSTILVAVKASGGIIPSTELYRACVTEAKVSAASFNRARHALEQNGKIITVKEQGSGVFKVSIVEKNPVVIHCESDGSAGANDETPF